MSKLLVRIISSLLLVGFLGFLVPMNNWHDYAHQHTTKHFNDHTDGLTFKQGVDKCAFCDLQLPLLFHESPVEISYWENSFDFLFLDFSCAELPVKSIQLQLRGPPANDFI
ncbi:hypothetical protein D3C87_25080 [compost metagenome]